MSVIYGRVSDDLKGAIESMAQEKQKTMTDIIRELLEKGLERDELVGQVESLKAKVQSLEGGTKVLESKAMGNPVDYDAIGREVARQLEPIRSKLNGLSRSPEPEPKRMSEILSEHVPGCEECYHKLVDLWKGAKYQCSKCKFPLFWNLSVLESAEFVCPMCGSESFRDRS